MKTIIVFALLIVSVTMYGQADFSGNWKLNPDKSQFNETPGTPAAPKLVVEQKAGTITLQRNDRAKETLKIDSTASIEITDGDNKTEVSMKLAADEKGLVETRLYTYPESETAVVATKKTRTWTLLDDKKTLTITDHIEASNGGNYVMVLVYERE
ncbi:MAG: hypothetical protein ABI675_21780 [Chitinophagaceae bacterium]